MAGMQFEYDEKGGTFYYFVLSFYALVLIPCTYYFWPKNEIRDETQKDTRQCQCPPCQSKRQRLKSKQPWVKWKRKLLKLLLFVAWVLFILLAYKVSQIEMDHVEYDPFIELGIDRGANTGEIRKAYRKLSLKYHPDKEGGDSRRFMRIAKAYEALTNEESKKNWEEYGNPDGPGATHFGIALPKWIVERENSVWVLAVYGLIFMVILPVVVGTWWYRSIKFSGDQVLLDTTQLYYYFFHRTPNMIVKRAVMILAGSMEFEKGHNPEVVERPTDNEEIPALMRDLPYLDEKKKEKPLCYPYSLKARALIHAHFARLKLPKDTLEQDRVFVIKKCPYLINEMVNIVAQLIAIAHARQESHVPRLETIENCMKLSQMVVQAQWDNKSPLLQLPHIREDMLRHFSTKKHHVRSIRHFAMMKEEDRRSVLRSLSNEEYRDVMNVCSKMPYIRMDVDSEVLDEEDNTITAGSIVTVTVNLTRQDMETQFDRDLRLDQALPPPEEPDILEPEDDAYVDRAVEEQLDDQEVEQDPSQNKSTKGWNKNKKGVKGAKKKKKPANKPPPKKPVPEKEVKEVPIETIPGDSERNSEADDAASDSDNESLHSEQSSKGDDSSAPNGRRHHEDDEDDWMRFQKETKKENVLETKSKETHLVHCPYFPNVKHEWWWVYVADRRNHSLITAPQQITSLKDNEQVQLKFSAPGRPGNYQYQVCLKSDSYFDFDLQETIKLDVKEARKIERHPQWDLDLSDKDEDDDDDYSDDDDDGPRFDESSDEYD